jgi:DNA polymerase I-like protein with 3'-5' exonuclease and polymerase domains
VDLITLDFETFYSKDFSLTKMTTEEYVRDPRFEIVGVGVKVNNGDIEWASGTHEELKEYLDGFDWANSMVLAHNTMFDGAILSWLFGIRPRVWADTLCIARAVHGVEVGGSLKALAERYNIGAKGTEILNALNKRRSDFTDDELDRYGDYCINDVQLTYDLFNIFLKQGFPKKELRIIDCTLRMFINPMLELDQDLLAQHLENIKQYKDNLLSDAGVTDKKELMSNDKFAELLRSKGVEPPTKVSPTTGKETFAFAKTDEGFKALAEHENPSVQALVAARLGNKSTLEETRTQRFIDIAGRGTLPVPVRYYAAHTGRWGGDDKINLQNLPSRGPNGKMLKKSIVAPAGYTLIDCDSSQIEARVLAWFAGQDDLTDAFRNKEDVYVKMAARIYETSEDQITKDQRFVGKTTILGAGYGMGAVKFQAQLKSFGTDISLDEARRIINIYRDANWKISHVWREAQHMVAAMERGDSYQFGKKGALEVIGNREAIRLPSKLLMRYQDLRGEQGERGIEYSYKTRRGRTRIYGGKVIENVCQALARCVIGDQMLLINNKYRAVLTVHDSVIACVPESEAETAQQYVEKCMRYVPTWAEGLPLECESGVANAYGDCE